MSHSKKRTSHRQEIYYILCIAAVLVILLFSFFGPGGYRDLQKARLAVQAQHARVDQLERENARQLKTIEKLKTDPNAMEKHARDQGYGREGEIILQLPEKPDPDKPSPAR